MSPLIKEDVSPRKPALDGLEKNDDQNNTTITYAVIEEAIPIKSTIYSLSSCCFDNDFI